MGGGGGGGAAGRPVNFHSHVLTLTFFPIDKRRNRRSSLSNDI